MTYNIQLDSWVAQLRDFSDMVKFEELNYAKLPWIKSYPTIFHNKPLTTSAYLQRCTRNFDTVSVNGTLKSIKKKISVILKGFLLDFGVSSALVSWSSELDSVRGGQFLSWNDICSSLLVFNDRILSSGRLRISLMEKDPMLAFRVNDLKWASLCWMLR